jgi:hypothetical protein
MSLAKCNQLEFADKSINLNIQVLNILAKDISGEYHYECLTL